MSINDEVFFKENIVNVNKKISIILFCTIFVPVSFIILTFAGLWIVPHSYSLLVLGFSIISSLLYYFLIKKNVNHHFLMYLGILFTSIFVFLLGYKGVITLTISFAFPPFITCFYYNRRITKYTTIFSFIISLVVYWFRAYSVPIVSAGLQKPLEWFLKNFLGLVIEYVFLYLITDYMSNRTHKTLQILMQSMDKSEKAYDALKEKNKEVELINEKLQEKNKQLDETQFKIIKFIAECLGSHDLFTGNHVIHTQKYVEIICNELVRMGKYTDILTEENIQLYKNAAFLHDIGKIHVPEGILNKIGKFTDEEFDIMKSHPKEGQNLLKFLPTVNDGKFNKIAEEMAVYHHEKWDGSGYPNKLAGTDIPLCARIMAGADVIDALLSQRLYKNPMSIDEAEKIFIESKGKHFDPFVAEAVINCKDEISKWDKDFKSWETEKNEKELEWWRRYHKELNNVNLS